MSALKALIVDDSAMMRQLLVDIFKQDPEISVVGVAPDPVVAWEKIKALRPDVLTLDVEMPRMDGLTFLEKLMRAHPMPVVMVSSLTESGCQTTLRPLELGAVDFVTKPKVDVAAGVVVQAEEIVEKVKAAARARLRTRRRTTAVPPIAKTGLTLQTTHKVICLGASTGGTEALHAVLTALPADAPGIVIVQHMPAGFTKSFARAWTKPVRSVSRKPATETASCRGMPCWRRAVSTWRSNAWGPSTWFASGLGSR